MICKSILFSTVSCKYVYFDEIKLYFHHFENVTITEFFCEQFQDISVFKIPRYLGISFNCFRILILFSIYHKGSKVSNNFVP